MSQARSQQVKSSLELLSAFEEDNEIGREHVLAYAEVLAFVQHWPKEACQGEQKLLEKTRRIYERETARVVKQRRIFIQKLAEKKS